MKVKEAVGEILQNQNWQVNISIYLLIVLSSWIVGFFVEDINALGAVLIITTFALAIAATFLTFGYNIATLRNYMLKRNPFLPDWIANFKEILSFSAKAYAGMFLYSLIYLALISLVPFMLSLILKSPVFMILVVMYSILVIVAVLAFMYMLPAMLIYFCTNPKVRSCFNIGQANKIIEQDRKNYTKVFLRVSLWTFIASFFATLFSKIMILKLIFTAMTAFVALISSVLYGNYFRTILEEHKKRQLVV